MGECILCLIRVLPHQNQVTPKTNKTWESVSTRPEDVGFSDSLSLNAFFCPKYREPVWADLQSSGFRVLGLKGFRV